MQPEPHAYDSWLQSHTNTFQHTQTFQVVCSCGYMTRHHDTLNRAMNDHQLHQQTANRALFTKTLQLIGA